MIDVFIPVHRDHELPNLERLLAVLLHDRYRAKQIHVIFDGVPTSASRALAKKFRAFVDFRFNNRRLGKVCTLNTAVAQSKDEYMLFLDADTMVCGQNFLEKIVTGLRRADILDMKKVIGGKSLLDRCMRYEFAYSTFINWFFSRFVGKCLGVGGAAFAIRRSVFEELGGFGCSISEDFELATKAFANGNSFWFDESVEILNTGCSSWAAWFRQRRRWAIGTALWVKQNWRTLFVAIRERPAILVLLMLTALPSMALLLIGLTIPAPMITKIVSMILILFAARISFILPALSLFSTGLIIIKNLIIVATSFALFSVLFWAISQKFGYPFSLAELAVFYFFYCPLMMLMFMAGFINVFVLKRSAVDDWKI